MLPRKDVYPYEYMNDWKKYNDTSLPEKDDFYSNFNIEHIRDHPQKMSHKNINFQTTFPLLSPKLSEFRKPLFSPPDIQHIFKKIHVLQKK